MISFASLNPILSGHAEQFMRDDTGFAGLQIAPRFDSPLQSSAYYIWTRDNALNIPTNIKHAPGGNFARSLPVLSSDTYSAQDYGHETPVPDEIRSKYRNYIDADISAIRRNTDIIKLNHEQRIYTKIQDASVPYSAVAHQWNLPNSDPKADIDIAKEAIRLGCGARSSTLTLVMSEPVRKILIAHPVIADRIKYVVAGLTPMDLLAAYFEVKKIVIADQVVNSAQEGQTITPADIWSDTVFLCLADESQDVMRPTFARTFFWQDFSGSDGIQVVSYREEKKASDIHRSRQYADEKIVFASAGYRLDNVLA
jgi:hypothetical protein